MSLRDFPPQIEQIAKAAAYETYFIGALVPRGMPTGTADGALSVCAVATGSLAFVKPTKAHQHSETHALHEKIAADLAYELGLPVPPVQLVKAGSVKGFPHIMAMSYVPFPQPRPLEDHARLTRGDIKRLERTASAMRAYYTWILDGDHSGHEQNVIFGRASAQGQFSLAFIDHSHSLTHSWDPQNPSVAAPAGLVHHIFKDADNTGALELIDKINLLAESTIKTIINRAASHVTPPVNSDALATYLVARRKGLAAHF